MVITGIDYKISYMRAIMFMYSDVLQLFLDSIIYIYFVDIHYFEKK